MISFEQFCWLVLHTAIRAPETAILTNALGEESDARKQLLCFLGGGIRRL